jgi:hypothetical protein
MLFEKDISIVDLWNKQSEILRRPRSILLFFVCFKAQKQVIHTGCPAEFIPVTRFYISLNNKDRNMGTSLKDTESFQVLIFLSRSPSVARQISKRHSSSREAFCSITGVIVTCCSYSATHSVHILRLSLVHQVLYVPPQKEIWRGQIWFFYLDHSFLRKPQ